MAFWLTHPINAYGNLPNIGQVPMNSVAMPFSVSSMVPNSVYTFWCNDINMTWATRQYGKKIGDTLLSDASGKLSFEFLGEMIKSPGISSEQTKYYTFQLRDIDGNIKATRVFSYNLIPRT